MTHLELKILSPGENFRLQLESVTQRPLSDGECRVKLNSIGLNRADLLYPQNRYFFKPKAQSGIGFEGAGEVVEVTTGSQFKIGDKVSTLPMNLDPNRQGCLAEYGVFSNDQLFLSPALNDDRIQGGIWMAYLTAWGGLFDAGNLRQDETVLITAASSSVGIAAIQLAKNIGAQIIATTTSEDKRDTLLNAGADHALIQPRDANDFPKFEAAIEASTQGHGLDLSFDAVAGPAIRCLIKSARKGGRLVIQGMLDRRPMDVHAGVLMKRSLSLRGYTLDTTIEQKALRDQAIKEISHKLEQHQLTPLIHRHYAFSEYRQAFEDLSANQHIGKLIINN